MISVEKTAKTVDEAVQLALTELGLPRERVQVEVLEESRSLLGILGTSQARVRVTADLTFGERAAHLLGEVLAHMGVVAVPKVVEEDGEQIVINIEGEELGLLIGKHGQTLAALQHLIGLMANRGQEQRRRIILDAEGYRARREESLRHLALASARQAKLGAQAVTLDPMLPHERRIVHTALMEDPDVTTYSVGEDPNRRIVIEPRGDHVERPSRPRPGARPAPDDHADAEGEDYGSEDAAAASPEDAGQPEE